MTGASGADLRALKQHPFELLRELERRTLAAIIGGPGDAVPGEEWVGIGIRLGAERFVVPRSEVREVLMVPSDITRVPGAKSWVKGLANVRGHLLPIVDFRGFLGAGSAGNERSARVLVARSADFPVGLVVDEVYGFRRFLEREHTADFPQTVLRCDRYLQGAFRRGLEVWPVLRLSRLPESREFQRAAED